MRLNIIKCKRIMKLSSFHFQVILVVSLVCIVFYVYYMSKDIITLDREVRALKNVLVSNSQVCSRPQSVQQVPQVQQMSVPVTAQSQPQPSVQQSQQAEIDENNDETESISSNKIKLMLNNIDGENEDEEHEEHEDTDKDAEVLSVIEMVEDQTTSQNLQELEAKIYDESAIEEVEELTEQMATDGPVERDLTIGELRHKCKEKGLSGKGSKVELKVRLGL